MYFPKAITAFTPPNPKEFERTRLTFSPVTFSAGVGRRSEPRKGSLVVDAAVLLLRIFRKIYLRP